MGGKLLEYQERIDKALQYAADYGQIDGAHHKTWVIDQMVRALTGCPTIKVKECGYNGDYTYEKQGESEPYKEFIRIYSTDEDGEEYEWDTGIAP